MFRVVCYDAQSEIGGQWNYRPNESTKNNANEQFSQLYGS